MGFFRMFSLIARRALSAAIYEPDWNQSTKLELVIRGALRSSSTTRLTPTGSTQP
jgi:hypothetical protein